LTKMKLFTGTAIIAMYKWISVKTDFTLSVSKASDESGSDDLKVFVTWAQSF
jgi:hypothetical protein